MLDQKTKVPLSKDGSVHVTDEVYNTLISSLGALLSMIGIFLLVPEARISRSGGAVFGFSVYGFGLIGTFVSSALHHGVNGSPRVNHLLRQLDHFVIFLMIAGTFTPFCLILLRNSLGWIMLSLIWALALLGIGIKAIVPHAPRWFTTSLYIGMGWLGVFLVRPIYQAIHWQGVSLLVLGGLLFTAGGVIYGLEKPNPFPGKFGFHEIWHCFVLAGAASHFCVMYFYL